MTLLLATIVADNNASNDVERLLYSVCCACKYCQKCMSIFELQNKSQMIFGL